MRGVIDGLHQGGPQIVQPKAKSAVVEIDQRQLLSPHQHVFAQHVGVDQPNLVAQPFTQGVPATDQHGALVGGCGRMVPEPAPERRLAHQPLPVPAGAGKAGRQGQTVGHPVHLGQQAAKTFVDPQHLIQRPREGCQAAWPMVCAATKL